MIKCVIFDLGGVLLNLDISLCFKNFESLGVDMKDFMKHGAENKVKGATICEGLTTTGVMDQYQVGKVSTHDFIEEMRKLCRHGTTYEQVLDAWNSWLLDIPQYKLDLIMNLRQKGYKTFMLSNTNDAHWKYFEKKDFPQPITDYFDDIFLSQELGLAKPEKEIYLEVLKRIGFKPEECMFIDDSRINCDAAAALGIKTVKYNVGEILKIDL